MKNIKKVWQNKGSIANGIKNTLLKKASIEKMFNERLDECMKCEDVDTDGEMCFVKLTSPCCSLCGCSLKLKLRDEDSSCANTSNPKWGAKKL